MFLIPIIQLLLLGYAATTDIKHLPTAVLDQDRTPRSRELIDAYRASGYFDITQVVGSEAEMARAVDSGDVQAGLTIPAGYERVLARGEKVKVGFVIDGSDPSVASTALSAAQAVGQAQSIEVLQQALPGRLEAAPGIEVHPRVWYRSEYGEHQFHDPGPDRHDLADANHDAHGYGHRPRARARDHRTTHRHTHPAAGIDHGQAARLT